jgi:hypothetical protein
MVKKPLLFPTWLHAVQFGPVSNSVLSIVIPLVIDILVCIHAYVKQTNWLAPSEPVTNHYPIISQALINLFSEERIRKMCKDITIFSSAAMSRLYPSNFLQNLSRVLDDCIHVNINGKAIWDKYGTNSFGRGSVTAGSNPQQPCPRVVIRKVSNSCNTRATGFSPSGVDPNPFSFLHRVFWTS